MSKFDDRQWSDFVGRFQNYSCPLCKRQALMFSEPHFCNIAGMDAVAVTCASCANVEIFNAAEICRIADEIDKEYRDKNWR